MADFKPSRATLTVVGSVGRVEQKFDGALTEVSIAVNKGYKDKNTQQWVDTGTDWYTYVVRGDWQSTVEGLQPGDRIEITGAKLEHRVYQKREGGEGITYEITFGELEILERKADRQPAAASASGF